MRLQVVNFCRYLQALLLAAISGWTPLAEGADYAAELPRIPPVEAKDALKLFDLPAGYAIQQIAAEPLVTSPVATCFDENGRLFVVEMRDYSEQDQACLGEIALLEDLDHDGIYDKSTRYATGLSWPTAIICYDGGVFVGAAPDIYYLKDTDHDGLADVKKLVFTGFGRSNVQGLMNCFRWGPDNRIHAATSSSGASVTQPDRPDAAPVVIRGRDFSFDPKRLDIRPESGGGQHGMHFDDWGRKFVCSNSIHAQFVAFDERYYSRNPLLAAPSPRINIAVDGGQATVFRSSPVEPWRIVRTRMRMSGESKGMVEGGGRAAGYFTGATGITIYQGDAFEPSMKGVAIVGDVGSNIVHRKMLTPNGISLDATRIDEQTEFVRSSDIWFRPVQFANAPDGCLHVLDMYREVIEHPIALPPEVKQHLDLTSGMDRGRLYRVTPAGYKHRATPAFGPMSSAELVVLLAHDNGWHRETASRLLYERQDQSVVPLLVSMANSSDKPLGRLHAAATLNGMGALDAATVAKLLTDSHPRVRERALIYAEQFTASPEITATVSQLVNDDDLRVRYQLAYTAGEFPLEKRIPWLVSLIKQNAGEKWILTAALTSLSDGEVQVLHALLQDSTVDASAPVSSLLQQLIEQVAKQKSLEKTQAVLKEIQALPAGKAALRDRFVTLLLANLGPELSQKIFTGDQAGLLDGILKKSRNDLAAKNPAKVRLAAIDTLKLSRDPEDVARLAGLLNPTEEAGIQTAALASLAAVPNPEVASLLLQRWRELSPALRLQAEEILFSRPVWTSAALNALEQGTLPVTSFSPVRLQALAKSADVEIQTKADKLLRSLGSASRVDVVQKYMGTLTKEGSAEKGKALFKTNCAGCHRLQGVGIETGPNLAAMRNRGKEAILLNVLDPNREVNPMYLNYIIELQDGRTQTGMIRSETATSLSLVRAENQSNEVLRKEIEQILSTGQSLMPEGLEKQLDEQAMADLLTYLMSIDTME